MRQHPPGYATADDVEDAVKDLTEVNATGPAAGLGRKQQRHHELPLFISQVSWITLVPHDRLACTN